MTQVCNSRNWLLHARYVRGEHSMCLELSDELQKKNGNTHIYAHFIKGLVLADAGRLQEALDRFHSCIKLYSQDPEPLKQVARCLYRQDRFQLSYEAYLEADKLAKHLDAEIYCGLAECSWKVGDAVRGVEWARAGVQAGGGERAGALLARLLLACDLLEPALQAYDQAIAANACGADTLAAAGALRLRAGDPRGAFQLLGAALAQQPGQHAAALALAAMLLQHGDAPAALARLKAALAAHPTCVAAHSNLGLALLTKKKYVAGLTCLQQAVQWAPLSARAAHNLALALLACRRPASAFCRLASATALQPQHPHTVLLLAIALERLGDSRADAAYARALSVSPHDALVTINVAGRHGRAGRLQLARHEAHNTARLLQHKGDAHLASSLSVLMSLLQDAGAHELSDAALERPPVDRKDQENAINDNFDPDEV
ncbi:PREDICTED: Bardet-Biedl syndrome 4 protein homolog isoform X1 [Papilio polytes]|uniref:Bardet-Biedl syndrome 4 protein homolog isoform X1 n=2 Tax=Papilio polytes TaxID=76194 RepID=UPI000676620F|nr:PREDICTED: Bardet-Biedl syndrome 4 protein homolog isoform X1 [Papilio polytes]